MSPWKKTIPLLVVLVLALAWTRPDKLPYAQLKEAGHTWELIDWHTKWELATADAQRQGKPVLVVGSVRLAGQPSATDS